MSKKIIVYSAGGVAQPLIECMDKFSKENGIIFKKYFGKPSELIEILKEGNPGDLISTGAEFVSDQLCAENFIENQNRFSIGFRFPSICFLKKNLSKIQRIEDLFKKDFRVGVAYEGCLTGLWESIILEKYPEKLAAFRNNINYFADSCGKLIQGLLHEETDAIIGWNTFKHFHDSIAYMRIPTRIFRGTQISILNQSENKELARSFCNFLLSKKGKQIYNRFGWITDSLTYFNSEENHSSRTFLY